MKNIVYTKSIYKIPIVPSSPEFEIYFFRVSTISAEWVGFKKFNKKFVNVSRYELNSGIFETIAIARAIIGKIENIVKKLRLAAKYVVSSLKNELTAAIIFFINVFLLYNNTKDPFWMDLKYYLDQKLF